jgi:opacity protein-like surface antigen
MKLSKISKLTSAIFSLTFVCLQPQVARAGGQGFSGSDLPDSKQSFESSGSSDLGVGRFESSPFQISVSARAGYDDNVFQSSFDPVESIFSNIGVGVTYRFGGPRTQMSLTANAGTTYYWDTEQDFDDNFGAEDEDDGHFDFNASVGFSITHRATPRLTLAATVLAAYQSQPDFNTFNQTTITVGRQSRDFFFANSRFSAAFAWTPRFSTNTSYSLGMLFYDDDLISQFEDRFEHTIGNEFRFLVLPTTTAIAEYRFAFVDYTDNGNRNSHSHFFLAGVDHSFSPRFNVSARAGVEVREFENGNITGDTDETRTSPYAEATVNYALAQSTQISWFNRFSLEQPDVPESFSRQTFRTGLSVRHNFTARISVGLNAAYQHDENEGSLGIAGFDEDSFDISIGARYAINRNWAIDAGYHHTEVVSDEALFREFSRNRYYVGATFTF